MQAARNRLFPDQRGMWLSVFLLGQRLIGPSPGLQNYVFEISGPQVTVGGLKAIAPERQWRTGQKRRLGAAVRSLPNRSRWSCQFFPTGDRPPGSRVLRWSSNSRIGSARDGIGPTLNDDWGTLCSMRDTGLNDTKPAFGVTPRWLREAGRIPGRRLRWPSAWGTGGKTSTNTASCVVQAVWAMPN